MLRNISDGRVYSAATDRASGVVCDQSVMLNGYYSAKKYAEHLRIKESNHHPTLTN